eukprot:1368839-Pleurochrysis_carterae.AAC.5
MSSCSVGEEPYFWLPRFAWPVLRQMKLSTALPLGAYGRQHTTRRPTRLRRAPRDLMAAVEKRRGHHTAKSAAAR